VNQLSTRKILLLEDEDTIAESIIFSFEREFCDVTHVDTCAAAFTYLQETSFDLAIFDIGLPDGSGLDLCQKVRTFSQIPIIFLTARSEEVDRILGLEFGADDYLTKPFSPRELIARAKAILRRTYSEKNLNTEADTPPDGNQNTPEASLQIDEALCQISYAGKSIPFTSSEYKLLTFLKNNPNRVYSREQLLYAINEDPGSAMDRVIDAHIKSIRAKIKKGAPDAPDFIETRRGLGYRFKNH